MTLRKKTIIIIGATLLGLIGILYFISQNILLGNFTELEERNTHQNVERVLSVLSDELSHLEATTGDWSAWDDTYAFIEDASDAYISSNLIDGTFVELRLNLMMFIHTSGRTVFSKAFDLDNEEEIPVPQSLQEHISTNSLLLTHLDSESIITGIVLLPEYPMLIASQPILTSEDEGPIRGTLVMGRYLNATEIERLAEVTHFSLTMHRFTDAQMPSDFQEAISSLSEKTPILVQPLDEQSVAGYAMLPDIYGEPSLVLRVDMPRDIYQQGQVSLAYLMLSIVGVGLVFGILIVLLLEKQVLSRLTHLSKSVSSIGTSGDLSARVSMTGTDELSSLAGTINEMVDALQQSQDELRENEEKLRLMFESATDSITVTDLNGAITEANERAIKIHGFSSKEELLGKSTFELIAPRDHERAKINMAKTLEEGAIRGIEYNLLKADGSEFPGELSASVLKDAAGNPVGLIAITRDITERKQAEEALQESEERYRDLFENANDLIQSVMPDGHFLYVNHAWCETLGYTQGEVSGLSLFDVIHPDSQAHCMKIFQRVISGEIVDRIEAAFVTKDGKKIIVEGSVNCRFVDGKPVATRGIFRDITERKRMLEQLRESEERYRTIFKTTGTATMLTEENGTISLINTEFEKLSGWSKEELEGKKSWSEFVAEEDLDRLKEYYRQRKIDPDAAPKTYEYRFRDRWGNFKNVMATVDLIPGTNRGVGSILDITELKQAQHTLQEQKEQLDVQNEELLAQQEELVEKTREVEAASQAKSDFLSSMSHEVRTPLNAIIGFSELMLDGIPGEINDEQKQCLSDILSSGHHLLNLINDVLDLSSVEAGKIRLKLENLSLVDVINDAAQTVKHSLDNNRHKLGVSVEEGLPQIRADRSRLRQIFLNLLDNAIKFTPVGGKLSIEASRKDDWCQVSVIDSGLGIKKENREQIFEAFTQAETLPDRERTGTGLGLAVTKQLVDLLGGEIWIESEYGKGSKFIFTLPLVKEGKNGSAI